MTNGQPNQLRAKIHDLYTISGSCSLCDIKPSVRNTILKKTKHTVVIVANPMRNPGHVVVCVKRHVVRIDELTDEELLDVFKTVSYCNKKLLKGANSETACDISVHYRPFLRDDGVKVGHFHVQLVPMVRGDKLHLHRAQELYLLSPSTPENDKALEELFATD